MQNFDQIYDQAAAKLKQATGGDQGVMQYVEKYRKFAKEHPIAQSFIYAALIAAAGISGAGAGGAAGWPDHAFATGQFLFAGLCRFCQRLGRRARHADNVQSRGWPIAARQRHAAAAAADAAEPGPHRSGEGRAGIAEQQPDLPAPRRPIPHCCFRGDATDGHQHVAQHP